MKAAAIFILVLCLAALGGIGYLYLNSNVTVSYAECIATDPVTQLEIYNQLTSALSAGTLIGTPFAKEPPASPEDAVFYLTLKTAQNIRELTVTYYIWGLPFTARVTAV